MASYTSAEVERILGIKNSVLRYWVDEMPLIQPKRDLGRHRVFSGKDLRLLFRLKYLLYVRHFTIEEARKQLEKELSCDWQDLRAELDTLRSKLLDLLVLVQN
ncbi:MAG: MerR family transcriptional regulator [Treponema sp.]|jgi:DNA-binding transcriptional MerR regulator|nr:MerR family transcriptional regulator [Treponema sp.]